MFETRSEEIAELAGTAAVTACWAQWAALGAPTASAGRALPRAMVDIEALVLLSLHASAWERRLADLVAWWARVGSRLTGVQRLRSLGDGFPAAAGDGVGVFARLATDGGDRRWSRHVDADVVVPQTRAKGTDAPSLTEPCALWLRLRAGSGVGVKADTLAHLLGIGGGWASVREIALATGYSTVAVRGAAGEMVLARLVRETADRPARYCVRPGAWAPLLELEGDPPAAPPWRFWSEIFAFLAEVRAWSRAVATPEAPGPHVLASRARDVMETRARAFTLDRIPVPAADEYRGLEAVDGLAATTRAVAEWLEGSL